MAELSTGEIKITYGDYGSTIEEIELLLLPKAKMKLTLDSDNNKIVLGVYDCDFDNQNLKGSLDYKTIDSVIRNLVKMRNCLTEDEEDTTTTTS